MKLVEGWHVPEIDECCINAILVELPDLNASYQFVKDFRTVIQAGSNVGVYPASMANRFERVITVEPDFVNYQALLLNTKFLKPANALILLSPDKMPIRLIVPC